MELDTAEYVRAGSHGKGSPALPLEELKRKSLSLKLITGALLFGALTFSIFYYQFSLASPGGESLSWHRLRFGYLLLLLLCLPFDTLASALRIWLVCRVLERGAGFWVCLKAEWANVGVAMLTPSQTGGGFGQIYMLSRSGISIAAATIISLITFLGTMVGLLCAGFYSVLNSGGKMGPFFSVAVWPLTTVLALMALPLVWPGLFRVAVLKILHGIIAVYCFACRLLSRPGNRSGSRLPKLEGLGARVIDLAHQFHNETWKFVRRGKYHFAAVCMLSLVFIVARCFMAFLCLRFLGIETSSLGEVFQIQIALIFLLYFAPTPGSSGIAELFSISAMSAIIPPGLAVYYNLLWRTSILYLPAVLGLLFLSLALLRDTRRAFQSKALLSSAI